MAREECVIYWPADADGGETNGGKAGTVEASAEHEHNIDTLSVASSITPYPDIAELPLGNVPAICALRVAQVCGE